MSNKESKSFRRYVPVMLHGRIVRWYYECGEPRIRIEIPVRAYPKNPELPWATRIILVEFERRTVYHKPDQSHTVWGERTNTVEEILYKCENDQIKFEEEHIPFINL